VLGSANTDLAVIADRLPGRHETVLGGEFRVSFGGKGANQALAAKYAGADVILFSRIGTDTYGNQLYEHLCGKGLDPEGLLRDSGSPAGVALIVVDREGNNQIAVAPGSNARFSYRDLYGLEHLFRRGSVFLTQLEIPLDTVRFGLQTAKSQGLLTVLDPAPAQDLPGEILELVDVLTPNEREAAELAGTEAGTAEEARDAARILQRRGASSVVVTLGSKGAVLASGDECELIPAFGVRTVDSVAAGDAFSGGLARALAGSWSWPEAMRYASAAGALSATRRGAQESLATEAEIRAFLDREAEPS
jgi:ribokinase